MHSYVKPDFRHFSSDLAQAGNDKYDLQRAEQMAKEKARAHIRFEQVSKKRKVDDRDEVPATSTKTSSSSTSSNSSSSEPESEDPVPEPVESNPATAETAEIDQPPKKKRKRMTKAQRDQIKAARAAGIEVEPAEITNITKKRSKSKKKSQKQPLEDGGDAVEEGCVNRHNPLA